LDKKEQGEGEDLYNDGPWKEVRKNLIQNYIDPEKHNLVNDQLLIQQQN
jgi:hypothetical protein